MIKIVIIGFVLVSGLISCNKEKQGCIMGIANSTAICTADYNPVCGCNEVTYSNACSAKSAGVPSYTQGKCP